MPLERFTAIDLFSGAGGLTLGLRNAGWDVVASVECDAFASATHRKNFPLSTHFETDVRNIDWRPYHGKVNLVAGGPPCQPFSVSGKQQGEADERDMVPEFIRTVDEIRPDAFMMENVKGLTLGRFRPYLLQAAYKLEKIGYEVAIRVLNSADFGVPQRRERVFVIGVRDGVFSFPVPTHGPGRKFPHVTVSDALWGVPVDDPNPAKVVYCKNPVLRKSPYAGMLLNGKGRPLDPNAPSLTIPASAGGNRTHLLDQQGELLRYHGELMAGGSPRSGIVPGCRRLTLRECARLQSFPDDFQFVGPKSKRFSQVGNAVPPLLAEAVTRSILQSVKEHHGRIVQESVGLAAA
ncbi:MAG: DNA cytosine methyltransferase [Flavobacteriales bacterium]|nr:DNA cytosine methyltransferase [Flavobacteriales bacterium]